MKELKVKSNRLERQLITPDMHIARITQIIDVGIQINTVYNTRDPKVIFTFEILDEFVSEGDFAGQPLIATMEFTNKGGEKSNLFKKLLKVLKPETTVNDSYKFNLSTLIGHECYLDIIHKAGKDGQTMYDVIANISRVPKATKTPKAVNTPLVFSVDDHTDAELLAIRPQWIIKAKMPHLLGKLEELKGVKPTATTTTDDTSEI